MVKFIKLRRSDKVTLLEEGLLMKNFCKAFENVTPNKINENFLLSKYKPMTIDQGVAKEPKF